jgi:BirA family biotin operon repressor/biotin-[acetyl-CoA-carboxylase] ligase
LPPADSFTHLAEVGSTNDWLLARAETLADGHWVIADRQTAGRGRRGRAWRDGAGNLMASVLVKAKGPVQQLSFVSAVALRHAMAPVPVQLKWPNDLLLGGRKVSGILLERAGPALVIGFGVNIASAPADVDRPATAIGGDVASLFAALRQQFAHWRGLWQAQGFAPIRAAWLEAACGLGQRIEVRLGHEVLQGRFAGLDDEGALLLDLPSGARRPIHAGEVFGLEAGHAAGD